MHVDYVFLKVISLNIYLWFNKSFKSDVSWFLGDTFEEILRIGLETNIGCVEWISRTGSWWKWGLKWETLTLIEETPIYVLSGTYGVIFGLLLEEIQSI